MDLKDTLNVSTMPTVLAIFGGTGDLTRRKLVPALWQLYQRGMLPRLLTIVGFARQELTTEEYREQVRAMIAVSARRSPKKREEFLRLFYYEQGIFEDIAGYKALAKRLGQQDDTWSTCANKLFYLAVPPQYYKTIFQHLADSGLTIPCGPDEGWTRVIVEKPFGKDLATAQELDAMLGKLFREEQIYRIDHYLGKDTVQNILAFRFSNTLFDPSWDARSIAKVSFRFLEKEGVESRADFYDGVGALRDVGQNHLLQLVALFLMEHPGSFAPEAIRAARTEVLEALEIMDEDDIRRHTVRGQYAGYKKEKGVVRGSTTETYFKIQTHLKSSRWRGVPIYLEAGKTMGESLVEVSLTFRHHVPCLCPPGKHFTNVLRYRIQPQEGVYTSFWVKKPGAEMVIEEKDFSFDYRQAYKKKEFIDAYTKLLLDAIAGDQTLFVSTPEILASWRFVDPIITGWQNGIVPLASYKKRSSGPTWPPKAASTLVPHKQIGYVGLGKMGSNMVTRLKQQEWNVVATDPDAAARERVKKVGAMAVAGIPALVKKLKSPRVVWLMVPHQVVDSVLKELVPLLRPGDTVIDAGNSFYKDSIRRGRALEKQGIEWLDVGVSGGPSGARLGACLMIGGKQEVYKKFVGLFNDLATAGGYDYMGEIGSGHFVKMVHNGIEYGMMQAIAEGFAVMKEFNREFELEKIANLYNHDSVIESRLVGWLKDAYATYGPGLDDVSGMVAHSGEGQWTVEVAKELGVPVPIIEGALQFRIDSQDSPSYTGQVVSALRNMFGGHEVKKKLLKTGK